MPEDTTTEELREMKEKVNLTYKRVKEKKERESKRITYLIIILIVSIIFSVIFAARDISESEPAVYRYIPNIFGILLLISIFGIMYYSVKPYKKEDIVFYLYSAFKDRGTDKSQKNIKEALFVLDKVIYDLKKKMFAEKLQKEIQEFYDCLKHRVCPNASKADASSEQK